MKEIQIIDRSDMVSKLKQNLVIDPDKTAFIAVDMHRGHLDPAVATMPASEEDCRRVVLNTQRLFNFGRTLNMPIIHVILVHREIPGLGSEAMQNVFWKSVQTTLSEENRLSPGRKSTTRFHNLAGSAGTEIIPALKADTDYVINNKKRLDCFFGTDLEILLRTLGTETVVLTGINTNTCVMNTAFSAFNRDFQVIVVSDCVASMYGEDLHVLGLENVKRCLGHVLTVAELIEKTST
ncbi:MAG: cysteine hydrolase [Desulfobacterales bacterium]|nr:cysteine hydrolase [Desulfobacterales bacterium]